MAFRTLPGQYTLVLGAGVSARIVPEWNAFTIDVVRETAEQLERDVASFPGLTWDDRGWWFLNSQHPLQNEALLEYCWQALRDHMIARDRAMPAGPLRLVEITAESRRAFGDILRRCLYRNNALYRTPEQARERNATLDCLVEALRRNEHGRIASVITFNIDDWLERCLHDAWTGGETPWQDRFFPISHPTWGPVRFGGARDAHRRIPIYHLHGLLTSDQAVEDEVFSAPKVARRRTPIDAPNSLVFTEEQYWAVTATPSGFANHVMQSALQHSHCLFFGISMRDRNLLRWLGMRSLEHERTWNARAQLHFHEATESVASADAWRRGSFNQHVWVTRQPDALLHQSLRYRGVDTLEADHTNADDVNRAFQDLGLLS